MYPPVATIAIRKNWNWRIFERNKSTGDMNIFTRFASFHYVCLCLHHNNTNSLSSFVFPVVQRQIKSEPKVQVLSSIQMHPPKPKALKKPPIDKVPLHSGSDIYISTKDLIRLYTPKPALYAQRLAELLFGRDVLLKACVTKTPTTRDLEPLDEKTLRSLIVHVVNVFKKQSIEISESLVLGYIRNRLCHLQSLK